MEKNTEFDDNLPDSVVIHCSSPSPKGHKENELPNISKPSANNSENREHSTSTPSPPHGQSTNNVNSTENRKDFKTETSNISINEPNAKIVQQCSEVIWHDKIEKMDINIGTLNTGSGDKKNSYMKLAIILAVASTVMALLVLFLNNSSPLVTVAPRQETTFIIGNSTFIHIKNLSIEIHNINKKTVGAQSGDSDPIPFGLTFINVTHWRNLSYSDIDDRLFNFVLATSWSQLVCAKMRVITSMIDNERYVKKAVETLSGLNSTAANLTEYEFIDKFRNLSVIGLSQKLVNERRNDTFAIAIDFLWFLDICIDLINSFSTTDGRDQDNFSDECAVVRSFNEIRNSLFDLYDEKLKLFLSELSSNVFTFASFLGLNFPDKSATSVDDKQSISVTTQEVFSYIKREIKKIENEDIFSPFPNSFRILEKKLIDLTGK